ncbi:MAG: hypothetical protein AMS18_00080 [Gemmatimonas sp. SG8_17]|nr:MAG: hypothetical protein AMS18_00080 [Gemmatimonas sp. SG8_17]
MSNPLQVYTVPSFNGGVNDFAAVFGGMQEDESLEIHNGILDGLGRITLRRGAVVTDTLLDSTATEIDQVLWVGPWQNGMAAVGWSDSDGKAWFYSTTSQDGSGFTVMPASYATPLYTGSDIPKIVAQEIEAPTEVRLYFCDADQNYNLKYVSGNIGSETITEPTEDFNDGNGVRALTPNFVGEFNYHLFITGFENYGEHQAGRGAEVVRYSTPGLVNDPTEGTAWRDLDFEPIGRPGEPIRLLGKVGGGLVIVKENNLHYWWGFDSRTWGHRHIHAQFGGENERFVLAQDWLYYMSNQGPCRTDGREVQFISQNIREFLQGVDDTEKTVIIHNPTKFQVIYVFMDANDSTAWPSLAKAFSYLSNAWTDGRWFESYADVLHVHSSSVVGTATLPIPEDAPYDLALEELESEVTCSVQARLTWVNGDTAPATTTWIYRINQVAAPITADWTGAEVYDTVASGVAAYIDSDIAYGETYWYQIRHRRNNVFSNWNDDATDPATTDVSITMSAAPTAPTAPSGFSATDVSECNGAASTCPTTQPGGTVTYKVQLDWTNNHGGIEGENACRIEIWGNRFTASPEDYELMKTVSSWDFVNEQTYATQSTTVTLEADTSAPYGPLHNYFKIRVVHRRRGEDCGKYSSFTTEDGPVIDENPCTCASIPV